ncbi:3-oxoacyl-ACP reductase FabG [Aquirhabdus parva]|uniref:3-oxoacyl-[acyl-carrier-protein] reductase n=1 Tax=Aquirhabdus parva TaxID=2283318 RepID=A0A345P471_9GAMM|nr:3-oxoacyl-ACP reductase FabG [Aquirhabdus parva]AXI02080.1 3-oxoacyl-ACP reductase FabG [Aquirhabdus parva]
MNEVVNSQQPRQVALVTGASRGIGAAIAAQLVAQGCFVVGTATSEAGAQQIAEALGDSGAGRVLDVRDVAAMDALLKSIEADFGAISVLVNNAGITKDNLLMRMSEADWQDILQVHLNAVFHLSKAVLRNMSRARFGRIINITSVVAQMGNAGQVNYAAAKAGVEGFSRALAREMGGRNITVNCVAPGFIATDMTDVLDEKVRALMLSQIPLGRLGEARDVAAAVGFLASAQAGYITGTVLPVNGGMYLG